jgi:CheY-like chemotaxis protein
MRLAPSPKRVLAVRPCATALRVLVVDSRPLHAVTAAILQSTGNALSVVSAEAETLCAKEGAFDIILMAVSSSTLDALVLAAHLRGIECQKRHPRRAAIIACTVRTAQYLDCLVPSSGLSGALNLPWTPGAVHACLDRWRGVKPLPDLVERAAQLIDSA